MKKSKGEGEKVIVINESSAYSFNPCFGESGVIMRRPDSMIHATLNGNKSVLTEIVRERLRGLHGRKGKQKV